MRLVDATLHLFVKVWLGPSLFDSGVAYGFAKGNQDGSFNLSQLSSIPSNQSQQAHPTNANFVHLLNWRLQAQITPVRTTP
ncbi:MAG: hypothetical protein ACK47C_06470 [Paracoccaceae bacterium]